MNNAKKREKKMRNETEIFNGGFVGKLVSFPLGQDGLQLSNIFLVGFIELSEERSLS